MICCNPECGKEIVSVREAAFEITGFEEPRAAGGTNHVLWKKRTGKVMCPSCVFDRRYGVSSEQMTLDEVLT